MIWELFLKMSQEENLMIKNWWYHDGKYYSHFQKCTTFLQCCSRCSTCIQRRCLKRKICGLWPYKFHNCIQWMSLLKPMIVFEFDQSRYISTEIDFYLAVHRSTRYFNFYSLHLPGKASRQTLQNVGFECVTICHECEVMSIWNMYSF